MAGVEVARRLKGLRVLVAEDEILISMLLEEMLAELGCEIVGAASTLSVALDMVDRSEPDVAILDLNLAGENANPVAVALAARGTPFVFATAYGGAGIGPAWNHVPRLLKPFTKNQVAAALALVVTAHPGSMSGIA
jgi:CheY-like chemotaxis protein